MTIKTQTGQLIQDPQKNPNQPPTSSTDLAQQQGVGTPTTPVGAKSVGANPIQAGMTGTPQQRQGALSRQQSEQKTLEQAERTETQAGATNAQQAAKDKLQTIEQFGQVKGRIESLIQKSLTPTSTPQTLNLQVADQALVGIADPMKQQAAKTALSDYSANPTPENLQKVYDIVGAGGIDTGVSGLFQTQAEAIGGQIQTQAVNLGTLNLAEAGVDPAQLAAAIGVTPDQLNTMTLQDLQGKIDAIQAQEFTSVGQIQAKLADPATSPQERQVLQEQLRQLGAAGLSGIEPEVDALQADLDQARMLNIAGQDYTVEELLADDGLSELVKQAVNDPKKMNELLKDQRTAALGQWINQHKTALTSLARQMDSQASDFLGVQDQYAQLRASLGEGAEEVLSAILGSDFKNSVLSGELQGLQTQLANSGLYQALKSDPKLTAELQGEPETLQALVASGFTAQQVKDAVRLRDEIEADPNISKLLGVDGKLPTDAASLQKLQSAVQRYEAIDPRIVTSSMPFVDSGDMDIDDLELLAKSQDPQAVLQDMQEWKQAQSAFKDAIAGIDPAAQARKLAFGSTDFDARDMNFALKTAAPEVKQQILFLFDTNGDGQVSDDELKGQAALDKLKGALAIGSDAAGIIGKGGTYNPQGLLQTLQSIGVDKGSFEKGASTAIAQKSLALSRDAAKEQEKVKQALTSATDAYRLKRAELENNPTVSNAIAGLASISIDAANLVGGIGSSIVNNQRLSGVDRSLKSNAVTGVSGDPNKKGVLEILAGDMAGKNASKAELAAFDNIAKKGLDKLTTAELTKFKELTDKYINAPWARDAISTNVNKALAAMGPLEREMDALKSKAGVAQSQFDKATQKVQYYTDLTTNAGQMSADQLYQLGTSMGVL